MMRVFRFDHESWCMVHCRPNSDIVQVTSNIANEAIALQMADELKGRGGYVFGCMPAGNLIAALEMLKNNKGQTNGSEANESTT